MCRDCWGETAQTPGSLRHQMMKFESKVFVSDLLKLRNEFCFVCLLTFMLEVAQMLSVVQQIFLFLQNGHGQEFMPDLQDFIIYLFSR